MLGCEACEGSHTGMREVTPATGWAVSLRRLRRSARTRACEVVVCLLLRMHGGMESLQLLARSAELEA